MLERERSLKGRERKERSDLRYNGGNRRKECG
jgi:hypothetical protein